jgi:hypothetical protein
MNDWEIGGQGDGEKRMIEGKGDREMGSNPILNAECGIRGTEL